jgi:hypothetical protein
MTALTVGGITARTVLERLKWNTALALKIKLGHKLFGLLVIFISQITLVLGGIAYSERGHPIAKTLVILEIILFFILSIIFEVMF